VGLTRFPAPSLPRAEEALAAFETERSVQLADEQKEAVRITASRRLVVVTGGPGVGKTTVVRAMLAVFRAHSLAVKLAAPTGRAAKRMTEATSAPAVTLHRLLEFEPKSMEFKRRSARPLEGDVLVVDESSMVDLFLGDALFDAIPKTMRVVLVGDVDQLPSVGPGAVLRDVLRSGAVPVVRLSRIFRQSSGSLIVENAHRINHGEMPLLPPASDASSQGGSTGETSDFFLIDRDEPEAARSTVLELVHKRIPHRFGLDPVRDVQVLVPMHRGAAGSLALNESLQNTLNPHGRGLVHGGTTFREHDKVMQLKNDAERNVWNGDVGYVAKVDEEENTVLVRYDDGLASREVTYGRGDLDELTLAYACTIHKSQGSEYPAVVVVLLTSHFVMLARNLAYTAITRGKRLVVVVSNRRALTLALSEERKFERTTRLVERMEEAANNG
jgi:exodeoxyribonuclease V alpha subunit